MITPVESPDIPIIVFHDLLREGSARAGSRAPRNVIESTFRSHVEHVFAQRKDRFGLFIRTIGLARAKVKIGMANLVYNFKRLVFWQRTITA